MEIVEQDRARPDDALTDALVAGLVGVPEARVEFVWRNWEGGFTFRFHQEADDASWTYFTWVRPPHWPQLATARQRARWVAPYVTVPQFSEIQPGLGGWWMTSAGLPGESAVSPWGKAHPELTVRAIAAGLRTLHMMAPVSLCPYAWEAAPRRERALAALADSTRDWRDAPDDYFAGWSDEQAYDLVTADQGLLSDLVVCHGDPCSPNTLVDPATGRFVGLVDLGELGVSDRWADLAVASWSLNWNFGPGWEPVFFEEYGIAPDQAKIDFYRLLWNAG